MMQDTLDRSAFKADRRKYAKEPERITAMGDLDLPTAHTADLDGRAVLIEDRPEQAHRGLRFRAAFAGYPNGLDGYAATETGAIDALADADREETERRSDLAAHGDSPWWIA